MVFIQRTMQAKHTESLPSYVKDFRDTACSLPLPQLPSHLSTFATQWPFPRGDLYHWISLLNRFDAVLETFCKTYKLDEGLQIVDFSCTVLVKSAESQPSDVTVEQLKKLGYGSDGDQHLVKSILQFSSMLLQNCGNRSIYASSAHLNNLLNSSSLSIIEDTLLLASELAQRYQAALKRINGNARHVNTALLANHYNIDLDRVLQLALPFTTTISTPTEPVGATTPATPTVKGKERAFAGTPAASTRATTVTLHANDLVSIAKGGNGISSRPKGAPKGTESQISWENWGDVKVTYYPKPNADQTTSTPRAIAPVTTNPPTTPTPLRRSSNLGPNASRSNRQVPSEETPTPAARAVTFPTVEEQPSPQFKSVTVTCSELKSLGIHSILRDSVAGLPQSLQYELLAKLRTAKALTTSLETRRQVLAVRLLAVTNLAYIHTEGVFLETVLKQDSEEPRRLQLVYQLADLVHPPVEGEVPIPRPLQTVALDTLCALAEHSTKYPDVCGALNTNVNHGVLLYIVRKVVAEMKGTDETDKDTEDDIWRNSVFSLLAIISTNHRTSGDIVSAGLVPILVEVLNMRGGIAGRYQVTVLTFLDNILFNIRDALQTLVNADGLDAVSNLIVYEVKSAAENAAAGLGIRSEFVSAAVDYKIPYFQQQTIKWLFKFIHHMMSTAGGFGGNFDRLLRNLIDSAPLLASLRQIIGDARCFGSVVWTNAVSILNDFINNEPTSYAVIVEAGLSTGFIEAVTDEPLKLPPASDKKEEPQVPTEAHTEDHTEEETHEDDDAQGSDSSSSSDSDESVEPYVNMWVRPNLNRMSIPRNRKLANGIMATSETINIIPQAFGSICLNSAGMKMFRGSNALERFFEIFESPEHIKCMEANKDLPSNLGSTFDELIRHHPTLRSTIMNAIHIMIARVVYLCNTSAKKHKTGAKLWTIDQDGKATIADFQIMNSSDKSQNGKGKAVDGDADVEMQDVDARAQNETEQTDHDLTPETSMAPYLTAVATFMSAFFSNSAARADFLTNGGIEFVLDLVQAPCLEHDFADASSTSRTLNTVVALLVESKPHLTIPSLLKRTLEATQAIAPFFHSPGNESFFAPFVNADAHRSADDELFAHGTSFAKAFVNIQALVSAIHTCLQASSYNHGHRSSSSIFGQLNVADYQVQLIEALVPLLSVSLKEEVNLQKAVPEYWRNATRLKEPVFREPVADSILGIQSQTTAAGTPHAESPALGGSETPAAADSTLPTDASDVPLADQKPKLPTQSERETTYFKNFQTLRYSLGKISRTVSPLLQTLGKSLISKRNLDSFQKQGHVAIAEALAKTVIKQLSPADKENSLENYSYWIGMLHVLEDVLVDTSRHTDRPYQPSTLVLLAFKDNGGFEVVNHILEVFATEIRGNDHKTMEAGQPKTEKMLLYELATAGMKNILSLYSHIVDGKMLTEATQTVALNSRDKDRARGDQFLGAQFLVELRMAVLPVVRRLWESELIERGSAPIFDKLIEVIRSITTADFEHGALKRSEKLAPPTAPVRKTFKKNEQLYSEYSASPSGPELTVEGLYRCNNHSTSLSEYCLEASLSSRRYPPPASDLLPTTTTPANGSPRPTTSTSAEVTTPSESTISLISGIVPPQQPSEDVSVTEQTVNELLNQIAPGLAQSGPSSTPAPVVAATEDASISLPETKRVTVDDLNEEREAVRTDLIDKCLDVINEYGEVTFQVADLITTVVGKSPDAAQQRRTIAETLVVALLSFAGDEDLKTSGSKIAAYAHLLALLIRDKQLYSVAVEELKDNENISVLLSFVKLSPAHSAEEPSPWISNILLIVELLLSEDAKPRKTKWTVPKDENDKMEAPILENADFAVAQDVRESLLEAILEILPRVGKDESLALSVLRILVILTRNRAMAHSMGEKKNIQRLFVMAKQLSSANSSRIQSPLMMILRHIIEDDDTVKQIMRAEIKGFMESGRHQRNHDLPAYLRAQAHLVIRNPELFVEVTNEMVRYSRWAYHAPEGSNRNILVLKDVVPPATSKTSEDPVQPTVQATEDLTLQDVKTSTENADSEMPDVPKPIVPEAKLPVVDHPDGVIHFLLCELLNYRDVEDKEPIVPLPPSPEKTTPQANGDVSMSGTSSSSPTSEAAAPVKDSKTKSRQEFKAEDHPIYIYRCFLLQCLTELLSSYNRTKIEFINFKRSAPPQAMTPSKPRSSVVNYLLFDLIPLGTLEHADTPILRKKIVTSGWADSVLTALLSKTGEQPITKDREPYGTENEADLLFVRRFVLENILKAYKEASLGSEALDIKYARMLSLADLMSHIMTGKEGMGASDTAVASVSQKQLRRIMFEKGFVTALATSLADMDLNFPGAKRAVKYILRPLKTLTTTAVTLSDLELVSATAGQADVDEIESATSVSDPEDDREETPDLFRNSTLGMFEPSREEDSSSGSENEDEEMYDEFGDEMSYEEDLDQDDVISEDEEIEGMGPIEGLPGDHGVDVEVIMEDDDGDEDDEGTSGEDDDDEDDEDEDEDDSEDDDARIEIINEIGEVQELAEGDDMGEWESDGEHDDEDPDQIQYEDEALDPEDGHHHHGMSVDGPLGQLLRSLGEGGGDAADLLDRMEAGELDPDEEDPNADEYMEDQDDDEEDDEEDEDMMFDYAMEGGGPPMGWQDEVEPPANFHRRRAFPPFPMFPGGPRDPLSAHRFHDPSRTPRGGPRTADDGTNPLLQRTDASAGGRGIVARPSLTSWMQTMGGMRTDMDIVDLAIGRGFADSPGNAAILEEVMRSMPPFPPHMRGNFQFHISAPPGHAVPRELEMMLGTRTSRYDSRRDVPESSFIAAFFTPLSTAARWLEEAKLLFGQMFPDRGMDVMIAVQAVLVPPAVEADKIAKAAEAERIRALKEAVDKKNTEEKIAREAKEAEEKAAREKKEAEEREAAEKAAAEAAAARGPEAESAAENADGGSAPEAMDGVETQTDESTGAGQANDTPAADRPRVTTIIRGSPFDITDLGIDADFLAELPEEIREEVIMSAVAERRSQATATGAQPSAIDQEFLNALPEDIRAEIVAQERADRRRQQRESAARASASNGVPAHDMDAASILATLDPVLRNQVLLEQDEDTLAMLPRELADQARAAMGGGRGGRGGQPPPHRLNGRAVPSQPFVGVPGVSPPRPARRAIVQMLDKPGVATLLRLMFIFQQGSLRSTLNSVLQNISLNRHNRVEVLTTLLHIIQDGSMDVAAVERSFAHLSLKAKQPKDAMPKTPATLKRALTGTPGTSSSAVVPGNLEASPLLVVQQCLTCLVYLNQVNPHIPAFFLTEHDIGTGLKRTLSRKGKGKENKASKYALNTLLALLDRDLIMESSAVMESLSTLLNMITGPLQALQRKQKEQEVKKPEEETATITDEPSVTSPETTTSTEPRTETSAEPSIAGQETTPVPTTATAEGGEASASGEPAKTETPAVDTEKARRPIIPPVIPEHNLQLVINIFVARECSSKTFRETLSTIKNLSNIPGAKTVFGRELINKAQALAETILIDLNDLLPQIEKATTGTEIQGVALAKFSPGGSDQNKLLRVLTALDHLFDPKREKKENSENETEGESSSQLMEKQDLLSTLYENSTFGPMWEKLSACLSAIRQREHLLNVATILLPLIEALMVVCKNTTLKDQTISRSQAGKELMLTSPPPESRMESLFFTFTEEHRKILNDLVRHTPKLMSGTFSLLVKNPKVLEFDNKRNYFSRSIHAKAPNNRAGHPPLQLSVRREQVFHDSFKSLYFQTGDQMKYGKLSIRFHGEEGVDAGGVTREWFQVLSRQMFDPDYALWTPVSSDRTTFHPSQYSAVNEEHLMFFKFIGRIIGKALYEGRVLDCHFSRAVYRRILGKAVSIKDMESLDPDYYKSVVWMLENDITDIITETFSVDNDKFGVVETIDFIPDGRNIAVTEENKHEYVRLMVEWKLTGSVKEQLDEFLKGFHEIIPADLVSIFNEQELELLISGLPEIEVDDWKSNTELHNYTAASPQIQWFWRAVRSFDKEERAKLLQFVTGTSKVPLNGFKELEGMNGFSRFNIHRDYGNKDRLPSSHTCFNQLDLPEYESYETLRTQLLTAITAGSEYFGFA